KPGGDPATVAVQETHGETGVHCTVREQLGERVHPVTGVVASYFLADYLAGEPANLDPLEYVDLSWVPLPALTRFIPTDQIYPPVYTASEAPAAPKPPPPSPASAPPSSSRTAACSWSAAASPRAS